MYLCPLRWSDMDAYQHVNNVVYLRYLEQARVDWMFRRASEAGVEGFATFGTVVAKHEIEYRRPLVYRTEPVRVEVWVTAIRTAQFTVAYEVCDDEGRLRDRAVGAGAVRHQRETTCGGCRRWRRTTSPSTTPRSRSERAGVGAAAGRCGRGAPTSADT